MRGMEWAVRERGAVTLKRADVLTFVPRHGARVEAQIPPFGSASRPAGFLDALAAISRLVADRDPAGAARDGGFYVGGLLVSLHEGGRASVFIDDAATVGVMSGG